MNTFFHRISLRLPGTDDPDDSLDVADALLAGPEPPAVGRLSGFTDFGADPPPHPVPSRNLRNVGRGLDPAAKH